MQSLGNVNSVQTSTATERTCSCLTVDRCVMSSVQAPPDMQSSSSSKLNTSTYQGSSIVGSECIVLLYELYQTLLVSCEDSFEQTPASTHSVAELD
jgi:hypothetical protein